MSFGVSVIVPACNEEKAIKRNVLVLENFLAITLGKKFEIIVCENGSEDKTFQEASKIKSKPVRVIRSRKGIFYALKKGQEEAKFEHVVFFPADLSYSPEFIADAVRLAGKYDLIIGSKAHPESRVERPLKRKIMSKIFGKLVRAKYGVKVRDTQGVMLWNRKKLAKCFEGVSDHNVLFQTQFIKKAQEKKLRMVEIPVKVNDFRKKSFSTTSGFEVLGKLIFEK